MAKRKDQFTESHLSVKGYVPDGNGGWIPAKDAVKPIPRQKKAYGRFANIKKNDQGMNKTEASYALHLEALKREGRISDWWFEKVTLKIAVDTRLTVDFMIQMPDGSLQLHDTKGSPHVYQDDAKVKMKIAANTFPFEFYVCFPIAQKRGGGWDLQRVKSDDNK